MLGAKSSDVNEVLMQIIQMASYKEATDKLKDILASSPNAQD